jgi:hypothetical protein
MTTFREFIEKKEHQSFVNQVLSNLEMALGEYKGWGIKPGNRKAVASSLQRVFPGIVTEKGGRQLKWQHSGLTVIFDLMKDRSQQERVPAMYGDPAYELIRIGLKPVVDASTPEEIDRAIQNIDGTLRHETTHFTHRGKPEIRPGQEEYSGDPKTAEVARTLIDDFLGDGELRAYATEYAYYYGQHFPDQPFDLQKMITIGSKLGGNKQSKIEMFFTKFADPTIQSKYEPYLKPHGLSLRKAYDTLVNYIQQELDSGRSFAY